MKRTLLITIATLVTIQSSFAQGSSQTSPVQNALSSLFEHLDLSHVSTGYLKDKAVEPESDLSDEEICNILQTSCISMLINHVVLKEGVYIQSLTERDIESLGIGKSDVDYVNEYIKELNRIHNEKSN